MLAYWQPLQYQGVGVDLGHLEPFDMLCRTPAGLDRSIHVVFESHVFTKGRGPSDPVADICFTDRVFCPVRYADGLNLPAIIRALPSCRVYQTWERRNYVYLPVQEPNITGEYHVFFEIKKGGSAKKKRVDLRVESAYRNASSAYVPPARPNAIRFSLLVENIVNGRATEFASR